MIIIIIIGKYLLISHVINSLSTIVRLNDKLFTFSTIQDIVISNLKSKQGYASSFYKKFNLCK